MQTDLQSDRSGSPLPRGRDGGGVFQSFDDRSDNERREAARAGDEQQRAQNVARAFAEAQGEFAQAWSDILQTFSHRSQELSHRNVNLLNEVVQSRGFSEMQSIVQRWMSENAQRNSEQTMQAMQRWNGLASQWLRVSSQQFVAPFGQIQQLMSQSIQSMRDQAEQIAQAAQNLSEHAERTIDEGIRQAQDAGERIVNEGQETARRFTDQTQENAERFTRPAQDFSHPAAEPRRSEDKPGEGKPDLKASGKPGGKGIESTAGQAD